MADTIALSVRALAEYAFRSGSIESGFGTAVALAEGAKAHKSIQQTYEEPDRSEVHLAGELVHNELTYRIEGRCDGLRYLGDGMLIEEIKSTSGELAAIGENTHPVHWAGLRVCVPVCQERSAAANGHPACIRAYEDGRAEAVRTQGGIR